MNNNHMGREECRIQVNEEDWVTKMKEEFEEVKQKPEEEFNRWKAMSIYRIPWSLKNLSQESYQPQMVAIGPYHHEAEQLKDMEEHKKRALRIFLDRSKKPLHDYINALTPMLQDLKNAYQQLQPADDFLKMMVLDGCFLLELLRTQGQGRTSNDMKVDTSRYKSNDPVFSEHGRIYFGPHLKRDILMLENQIPLPVLIKLVEVENIWKKKHFLTKIILKFFDRDDEISSDVKFDECLHILDLYRRSVISFKDMEKKSGECRARVRRMLKGECINGSSKEDEDEEEDNMRSATELAEAGVRFVKVKSRHVNQITFTGGELMLPKMKVDDATKTMYLNMMAFERLHVNTWGKGNHVTSYVYFMDRLIDTAKDVSLLHKRHIMVNSLGSDQGVADLFNFMSTDICPDPANKLFNVQQDVVDYFQKPVPGCIAYAQHTYFTNPWVSLSIFAAIFLFALTITQTVYAVLDYHKP